ncbi:MAG: hypothetical protein ABSH48_01440 [Verrucomicrobiota bacterium]
MLVKNRFFNVVLENGLAPVAKMPTGRKKKYVLLSPTGARRAVLALIDSNAERIVQATKHQLSMFLMLFISVCSPQFKGSQRHHGAQHA